MEGNTIENQFVGSKISLISKSERRYEGILYSLDLQNGTISLAKVRSFGTEDRAARQVRPEHRIYEFIIFRGSSVKGLCVIDPPRQAGLAGHEQVNTKKAELNLADDPAVIQVNGYPL